MVGITRSKVIFNEWEVFLMKFVEIGVSEHVVYSIK